MESTVQPQQVAPLTEQEQIIKSLRHTEQLLGSIHGILVFFILCGVALFFLGGCAVMMSL